MDVPHPVSQGLERAELKLLHRALGAPERLGDLANALLLDETGQDDALLIVRQAADEADEVGEDCAVVDVDQSSIVGRLGRWLALLARPALPAIGQRVPRDLKEPGDEGSAAPLEATEVGECLVEDFGGQILGFAAAADTASYEGVNTVEVSLVELGEAARVGFRGLDQKPLVVASRGDLCRR
jgi:hypothetical protein